MWGSGHVEPVGNVLEVGGVDAEGVAAQVVDLALDAFAVRQDVGDPVGEPFFQHLGGGDADLPVLCPASFGAGLDGRSEPDPAAVLVLVGHGADVVHRQVHPAPVVVGPVSADHADLGSGVFDRLTTFASVHVGSIVTGEPQRVYDLEVEGAHEFVAGGVVVHNCQWWIHTPEAANQSFLMDLARQAMPANELLDWNANNGCFYGLMEEWQLRSIDLGHPITHWIVEVNAAQRFLLAYDHVRRWCALRNVMIVPHSTTSKKLDPTVGPWIIRDHFKFGRVRVPGKQRSASGARYTSMKLRDEVTRWPEGTTDDEVMACWFFFAHLPQLSYDSSAIPKSWRPSWLGAAG